MKYVMIVYLKLGMITLYHFATRKNNDENDIGSGYFTKDGLFR